MAKTVEVVAIKPIEMQTVEITIKGDTPLIMHAWREKAKRMMLEAQQGKEELSRLKVTVEVAEKEALEKFLREYEVEGRTMEEWFALIKKQEAEHGTERVDTGTPDGRSDV